MANDYCYYQQSTKPPIHNSMSLYGIDPRLISSQNYLELPMEELNNHVLKLSGNKELKVFGATC